MRHTLQRWAGRFPVACLLCHGSTRGLPLCSGCKANLPWQQNVCCRCALPFPRGISVLANMRCGHCPDTVRWISQTISPLRYEHPCSTLLNAFKHDGQLACGHLMGTLLAEYLKKRLAHPTESIPRPDVLIPVPLHWRRLQSRGFNQSHLIANRISAHTGIPVLPALTRSRLTERQQRLKRTERGQNLLGAFRAVRSVTNTRIALIDDVMTTGSTAATLAATLLDAGALSVSVWTVARTLPDRDKPEDACSGL